MQKTAQSLEKQIVRKQYEIDMLRLELKYINTPQFIDNRPAIGFVTK